MKTRLCKCTITTLFYLILVVNLLFSNENIHLAPPGAKDVFDFGSALNGMGKSFPNKISTWQEIQGIPLFRRRRSDGALVIFQIGEVQDQIRWNSYRDIDTFHRYHPDIVGDNIPFWRILTLPDGSIAFPVGSVSRKKIVQLDDFISIRVFTQDNDGVIHLIAAEQDEIEFLQKLRALLQECRTLYNLEGSPFEIFANFNHETLIEVPGGILGNRPVAFMRHEFGQVQLLHMDELIATLDEPEAKTVQPDILGSKIELDAAMREYCSRYEGNFYLVLFDLDEFTYRVRTQLHGERSSDIMRDMDTIISSNLPQDKRFFCVRLNNSDEYVIIIPSNLMNQHQVFGFGNEILQRVRIKNDWPKSDRIILPLTMSGIIVHISFFDQIQYIVDHRFRIISGAKKLFGRNSINVLFAESVITPLSIEDLPSGDNIRELLRSD